MITFEAPASRCFEALSRSVKRPVDSITTSAPTSPQGRAPGSRSEKTRSSLPSTTRPVSVASTVPGKRPRMESYLSRWARVSVSVMSFTPTQSMSAPRAWAARKTLRPMRPKPLIPALKAIRPSFRSSATGAPESIVAGSRSWPQGGLLNVPMDHVDQVRLALAVDAGKVLGHHHRAVAAAGAADPYGQVGLALVLVRGQQVVEQGHQPVVEV